MTMNLVPHAKLTKTLCLFLKLTIVASAVAFVSGIYELYSYSAIPPNLDFDSILVPAEIMSIVADFFQIVFSIIGTILFFRWIHVSVKNLRALSGLSMKFTPGWSVGWFFIPIASYFKSLPIMKEIWWASHKDEEVEHGIVRGWWQLFILSQAFGRLALKGAFKVVHVSSFMESALQFVVSDGLDLLLTIVTLVLVTRIGAAYSRNIVEPENMPYGRPVIATPDLQKGSE
jgi:hypothetical protein